MDPLWGYKGTYFEGGIRVPLFVNWPKVVKPGSRSSEPVIGVGDYKLKEYFEDGKIALYDLKKDIRERKNLTETMPEKRDELYRRLRDWQEDVGAPRPSERNPQFEAETERKEIKKALAK